MHRFQTICFLMSLCFGGFFYPAASRGARFVPLDVLKGKSRGWYLALSESLDVRVLPPNQRMYFARIFNINPEAMSLGLKALVLKKREVAEWLELDDPRLLIELGYHRELAKTFFALKINSATKDAFLANIRYWRHLKALDLSNSGVRGVPSLADFDDLEFIDFSNNTLEAPDSFIFPPRLKYLSLFGCGLSKIPDGVVPLLLLKRLWVRFNDFSMKIPDALRRPGLKIEV